MMYDQLCRVPRFAEDLENSGFYAWKDRAFVHYGPGGDHRIGGWKFHIAVGDWLNPPVTVDNFRLFMIRQETNISKGWGIVREILIRHRVSDTKVITPGYNFWNSPQHGKQITIYAFFQPELDWANILQEIENGLSIANVKADELAEGDRKIQGSHYVSYRYDLDLTGKYSENAGLLPPDGIDIFQNLVLNDREAYPNTVNY